MSVWSRLTKRTGNKCHWPLSLFSDCCCDSNYDSSTTNYLSLLILRHHGKLSTLQPLSLLLADALVAFLRWSTLLLMLCLLMICSNTGASWHALVLLQIVNGLIVTANRQSLVAVSTRLWCVGAIAVLQRNIKVSSTNKTHQDFDVSP